MQNYLHVIMNEDKDAYFELLERRVSLMKKYLEKYEAYKRTI